MLYLRVKYMKLLDFMPFSFYGTETGCLLLMKGLGYVTAKKMETDILEYKDTTE